ncbi:MAG: LysR family transcriptional regulator [Rhodobacteraceae bacterium]|nr:LysR family transcriptional regulator [Paracoccaceae bacterium]
MNGLIDALLSDLALVVRVSDSGGFTAAAKLTKIPQATVSRRIAMLEENLQVRLFDRTTRRVALTPAGRQVYRHAKLMLEQGEAAAASLQALQERPAGTLRVTCPIVLGQAIVDDIAAEFLTAHPDVRIRIELTGRRVDLVEEGYDIAIRVGRLPDSSLAVTRLASARTGLYASPDYVRRHRPIEKPSDLSANDLLIFAGSLEPRSVTLSQDQIQETVTAPVRMACNDPLPVLTAARSSLGIAEVPRFVATRDVATGALVELLTDWRMAETEINALTPSFRGALPVVREFLDLAKSLLGRAFD